MRTNKYLTQRHRDTEKTQPEFLRVSVSLCQKRSRGSALLSVLWLSVALAAIAFALSNSVRGETERASTGVDSLRSYYLAVGAVQRSMVELYWTVTHPAERVIPKGSTVIEYAFPSGVARVELLPEAGKLDVNSIPVQDLNRLMQALG